MHTQSVRCIATGNHLLASGGSDDRVRVYDLKKRQEARELLHHTGSINSIVFVDNANYLITGGSDGKIVFINTKKWKIDKIWEKAHKGAVTCISVHPQESLALTIGTDLVLKSWNLINGRNVYSTNLKNKTHYGGIVEHIRWSTDGEHFALTGARIVEVFSLDSGNVIKSHKLNHRVTDLCWIGDADLLVGQDNGEMFFFNIENDESSTIPAHETRLKAMFFVEGLLATVSSGGDLSLWHISDDYTEIIQLREYNLECRPTCLCIVESSKLGLTFERLENYFEESKINTDEIDTTLTKKVEEERVTVEYEDDSMIGKAKAKKSWSRSKKLKFVETVVKTPEVNIPEEFKGQKKRKILEEQTTKPVSSLKHRSKPIREKKFQNKTLNKLKQAMDFEVTDDFENDLQAGGDDDIAPESSNGSLLLVKKQHKNKLKSKTSGLSKSFVHNPKVLKKKKRQSV